MSNIIKTLRKSANLTQKELGAKLKVSGSAVGMIENGKRNPSNELIINMTHLFGVSRDELERGIYGDNVDLGRPKTRIPVYGKIAAGIPISAIQDVIDYEEITSAMASGGEYIALQVKGSSMEPIAYTGDVAIIRLQSNCENGDICAVMIKNEDATMKRVQKNMMGITLIPRNPAYESMSFTNQEIVDLPVTIIGKVVEIRRKNLWI